MLLTAEMDMNPLILHDPSHYFAVPVAEGKQPPVETACIRKTHVE